MGRLADLFRPKKENPALQKARDNMRHLRQLLLQLAQDPAAADYKDDLIAMEAILQQTDDEILLYQDQRIETMITELQTHVADPDFHREAKLQQLKTAIDIRDVMAKTKT